MKRKVKKSICGALLTSIACCMLFALGACGGQGEESSSSQAQTQIQVNDGYALLLDRYVVPNYASSVKVFDANNKQIAVGIDGCFLVQTPGRYTIDYGTTVAYIYAYAKMPQTNYVYSQDIDGAQLIAGDTLVVPTCDIQNIAKDYDEYTVTIWKDNAIVQTFEGGSGNRYFVETSGSYKLVYAFENVFGVKESDIVEFTATDAKRIVYAQTPVNEIDLGSEVTYNTYGYYLMEKYASTLSVETPSGSVYDSNKVLFNEYGEYTLTFSSVVEGTTVEEVHKVNTKLDRTAFFSGQSNINYVRESKLDEFCLDSSGSPDLVGIDAVQINSANSSGQVYYSGIIDLTKKTKDDQLIEFFIDKTNGEVQDIYITLVDVYNPQITLRFNWMQNQWNAGMSYGKVSANNQVFFWKNGNTYDTYFGMVLGCGYTPGVANGVFNCAFDWATQSAYMDGKVVADFSNEATVPPSVVWNGFTTGEVYLRIDFVKCNNGGIFVQSVDGKEMASTDPATLQDEKAICLKSEYETLPEGVKGMKYPLPTVLTNKVVDGYNVKISLFLGSTDKSALLNGESFTPDATGVYTVRYQAVDSFGKLITKSFDVQINETATPITIDGDFSEETVDIMSHYQIPAFTSAGGHGYRSENVVVKLNGQEIFDEGKGYLVNEKGTLSVCITVSDYLGNTAKQEYTLAVNDNVQLFHLGMLPSVVFAGDTINFNVAATNYKTGNEMTVTTYVNNKTISGDYTVPTGITELKVLFVAKDGSTSKASPIYKIAVNPNPLTSIKDYAQTDFEAEKAVLTSGVVYKLSGSQENYNFSLPYYLAAYEFAFKFGFNDGNINASGLTLTLQDAKNAEEKINVYFRTFGNDTMTVKVNDDVVDYSLKWSKGTYQSNCGNTVNTLMYKGKSYRTAEIVLDIYTGTLLNSAGEGVATIKKYANGEKFNGFTSGAVICSFALTGVSGQTEFILSSVCNQGFGYRVHGDEIYDNAEAVIALTKPFAKSVAYGKTYVIPALVAYDVLSPGGKVTLEVKKPNGDRLVNGYVLTNGYSFVAEEYGVYRLIFTMEDINGLTRSITVNMKVEYTQPPQATVNGTINTTYKVGDTLQIPSCTITENPDAGKIELVVLMRAADDSLYIVTDSFTFTQAGQYQLVYRITDEYDNVTRIVYNITVQ